ncbi:MAG: DUF3560 domain-containing protein [Sandaracinaceae bacterium]|nr:DUF3560 domain-containing protein [Sandaracinaceae bacterium]
MTTKRAERARAVLDLLESTLRAHGMRVPGDPEPSARAEAPTAFEAAVIADALAAVEADPTKPAAADVRIYLRPGRRYTRVFWVPRTARDDNGSILHFVENETGQVFAAASSKKVGRRLSRVVTAGGPSAAAPLEYVGVQVPRWFAEGVRVRVKATPILRAHGLRVRGSVKADNRAWPKEVGVLGRREGNGCWDWRVEFARGRTVVVDEEVLGAVARVRAVVESAPSKPSTSAGAAFEELLEGLVSRRIRTLRFPDTAWTPHVMKVARVLSHRGAVVVDGTIKKSAAKLTIPTDIDATGRPTKYAQLQKGARHHRVDPTRISTPAESESPPSAAKESRPPSPAAPTPAPSGAGVRRETEHQRQRRERAERRAERLERKADAQHTTARAELEHIPPGQPILVGHHSERRHRKALERSDQKTRQALETSRAAESAKSAAKRAGRAISSDDPEAIEALEARLTELEASRALSKAVNAAFRKGGWDAVAKLPGVTAKVLSRAKRTMELAPWMKAPMDVTNVGANIRRVRARIEELKAAGERDAAPAIEGDGFTISEHPEDNRVRFTFAERPSKEVTAKMKSAGFRWSREHGAWQRQLNNAGRYAAERMAKELFGYDAVEARRQAEPQARALVDHEHAGGAPAPESAETCRARAAITAADRARFPVDVIEEAEALGERPERVAEMREKSRREEEEMGRKLRRAARDEERAANTETSSDVAWDRLAEALAPLTTGTRETRTGQYRQSGPLLASAERTPELAAVQGALRPLLEAAERSRTRLDRDRLRVRVSAHLKVARRHANRLAQKLGSGSRAVRDARAVRDLLDEARGALAKATS